MGVCTVEESPEELFLLLVGLCGWLLASRESLRDGIPVMLYFLLNFGSQLGLITFSFSMLPQVLANRRAFSLIDPSVNGAPCC